MAQTIMGKYEVLAEIGQGGMSIVYKARDVVLDRFVALKVLSPASSRKQNVRKRFYQEAKVLSRFDHPNIVKIYDFSGLESETVFIASEYVDGVSLKALYEAEGKIEEGTALTIIREILKGLKYIHEQNVVHRDIKPSNILIDKKGSVLITDFGVAKDTLSDMSQATVAGSLLGTVSYMPLEQINGMEIDHRVDLYAVGVTLYELVTGRKPFQEALVGPLMAAIARGEYPHPQKLNSSLNTETCKWIIQAMALRPEDRFKSARAMLRALKTNPVLLKKRRMVSIDEVSRQSSIAPIDGDSDVFDASPMSGPSHPRIRGFREYALFALGIIGLVLLGFSLKLALDFFNENSKEEFAQRQRIQPTIPIPQQHLLVEREPLDPSASTESDEPELEVPTDSVSAESGTSLEPPIQPKIRSRASRNDVVVAAREAPTDQLRRQVSKPTPTKTTRKPRNAKPRPKTKRKTAFFKDRKIQPIGSGSKNQKRNQSSSLAASKQLFKDGMKAYSNGLITQSLDLLNQAIRMNPKLAEAHREIGKIYLATGDPNNLRTARTSFQTYLTLSPDASDRAQIKEILEQLGGSTN